MKKLLPILLAIAMLFLCACAEKDTAPKTFSATLYLPNANADGFDTTTVQTENDPQSLLNALCDAGAIPQGIRVLSMEAEGKNLALDLSSEFGDAMQSQGTAGETMRLGSVVNTFLDFFDADTVTLTVAGEPLATGHNVYGDPLERIAG